MNRRSFILFGIAADAEALRPRLGRVTGLLLVTATLWSEAKPDGYHPILSGGRVVIFASAGHRVVVTPGNRSYRGGCQ